MTAAQADKLPDAVLDLLVALVQTGPSSTPVAVLNACARIHGELPDVWQQIVERVEAERASGARP